MEKVELKNLFLEFRKLDEKKLFTPLTQLEEIHWAEHHEVIMKTLFGEAFSILLDQRSNIRVPLKIPVEYTIKGRPPIKTETSDISLFGMCIPLNPTVKVGSGLKIKFIIIYKKWIFRWHKKLILEGRINWASLAKDTMGVEFMNLTEKTRIHLFRIVYIHLGKLVDAYSEQSAPDQTNA